MTAGVMTESGKNGQYLVLVGTGPVIFVTRTAIGESVIGL